MLKGERHLKGERSEGADQELADGCIEGRARDLLTDWLAVLNACPLAEIGRQRTLFSAVIADGHPFAAPPAQNKSLQQRRPFPGRPGTALGTIGLGIRPEAAEVLFVLVPSKIAGVSAWEQHPPLLARQPVHLAAPVPGGAQAAAPEAEGPGVAGIVQDLPDPVVRQRSPH